MKAFNFRPMDVAFEFRADGYAHVRKGVSDEFFSFAQEQLAIYRLTGENEVRERKIKNKKRQYLFELPKDEGFISDLTTTVAMVLGANSDQITLSERHIKVYDDSAPPFPLLHKDCVASQVAVGIPLEQNANARIALVPWAMRDVNPLDVAVFGAKAIHGADGCMHAQAERAHSPGSADEQRLETVMLDVRPGDVIFFPGSSMYHERFHAAGSAVLYLKLNAMGLDFLGEDKTTPSQRAQGLSLLKVKSDNELLAGTVEISPRLQRISQHYTRLNWTTVLQAYVAGQPEFTISEDDLAFLQAMRGPSKVEEVLLRSGASIGELLARMGRVRRLAELGALDFIN